MSTPDFEPFSDLELTRDRFLSGRFVVRQPRTGYRAGSDPVLLAAACPAKPGQRVLELGCGAGVASLCLAVRVPGVSLHGIELQPEYAELARRNAADNGIDMQVTCADLQNIPASLKEQGFDHVIANPPYFDRTRGPRAPDKGREMALGGETPLNSWVKVAAKRLLPGGIASFIQDIRRLPELLCAAETHLGSIEIMPLSARKSRAAHLFLLRARKGGKADFIQHFPLVMHEGDTHISDGDSYSPRVSAVLRDGAALIPGEKQVF